MSKNWMKDAVPESHKGKFSAKAKAAGKSTHEYAEEKKGAKGTLGKEARLALTFEKERPSAPKHHQSNAMAKRLFGGK